MRQYVVYCSGGNLNLSAQVECISQAAECLTRVSYTVKPEYLLLDIYYLFHLNSFEKHFLLYTQ